MAAHKEIRTQVQKILDSPSFKASSLLSKFLHYVVEQTLSGNQKNIKAYNVAVDAFGRSPDFDAQKDTIVRITAGKLRKELTAYYAEEGASDPIRINIPKGTYQPDIKVRSNPIPRTDKHPWLVWFNRYYAWAMAFLIVCLGFIAIKYLSVDEVTATKPAILFFEIKNLNLNSTNDVWAKGITEEILLLSSRFSELEFYGPLKEENEIIDFAKFDNIEYLFALNGSLVKSDSLFILKVILTNYRSGKVLWAKSYKNLIDATSLIEIEYEVCNDISIKIGSIYGVVQNEIIANTSQSKPAHLASHRSILQYYKYLRILTFGEFQKTKNTLLNTVENDPEYGVAWSALAALYIDEYISYGGDSLASFAMAHQYINRALRLDPENVIVQNNRAYIAYYAHQMEQFEQAVTKLQSLNPSNIMNGEIGLYLVYMGESERGLDMIREAQEHAINYPGYFHLGPFLDYYRKGKYNKALLEANQIQMPEFYGDPLSRAVALINLHRVKEAIKAKRELLEIIPDFQIKGRSMLSIGNLSQEDVDAIFEDWLKIELDKEI